jgi:hypothetical protein
MEYEIDQAVQHIEAWKAHLLRSINQDTAKQDVLKKLDDNAALLVSDWAMKYVPCKYRESQRDWFGKRGISWHLSVAIKKSIDKGTEMLTFLTSLKAAPRIVQQYLPYSTMFFNS